MAGYISDPLAVPYSVPNEAKTVMDEAHRGIYAAHQGANTLARKLVIQGYYWPTMVKDCTEEVKTCPTCQAFAKKICPTSLILHASHDCHSLRQMGSGSTQTTTIGARTTQILHRRGGLLH